MKKFLCILIVAIFAMSAMAFASAETIPSPTIDLVISDGLNIIVVPDKPLTIAELKKMNAYADANGGRVVGYFNSSISSAIIRNANSGDAAVTKDDVAKWTLKEFGTIELVGTYKEEMGSISATFKTRTPLVPDQKASTVMSAFKNDACTRFVLNTVVKECDEEYSYFNVTFTPAALVALQESDATCIALVCE
jgi:hypothetical protein